MYVCALQRAAHKAQVINLKRLNALVRWLQRNPVAVVYTPITNMSKAVGVSDSSFRKEDEDTCHAMKGCLIGLMGGHTATDAPVAIAGVHVDDVICINSTCPEGQAARKELQDLFE